MAADWQTSQPCGVSICTTARKSSSHDYPTQKLGYENFLIEMM
jgi:hypothetical protein